MANGLRISCRKNTSKSYNGFYSPTLRKEENRIFNNRTNGHNNKYGPQENY